MPNYNFCYTQKDLTELLSLILDDFICFGSNLLTLIYHFKLYKALDKALDLVIDITFVFATIAKLCAVHNIINDLIKEQ
jgi:hypothetical protein